jgi:putative membrane protein
MAVETMPNDKGTALAEERTDLALRRTIVAAERTLMAWIRTAISMIGFGFTIFKFFEYLPGQIAAGNVRHPHAARNLGLTLIALGTLALTAAAWQHWIFMKQVGVPESQRHRSISLVVSVCVIMIGLLAFYGVLSRVGPF